MAPETILSQPGKLKLFDPSGRNFNFDASDKPTCPNDWFAQHYPDEVQIYGSPFIELSQAIDNFTVQILPVSINTDFFAGVLGGRRDLGHHVMYIEPEMQWYFLDSDQIYKPTSPEKLANLYRALMIRCAQEMPGNVHKLNLFHEFRSDKTAKAVVQRAKSILQADHTFFSATSPHQRIRGPEIAERLARVFIESALEKKPGSILTLTQAYTMFCKLSKSRSLNPVPRPQFKGMMSDLMKQTYGISLRRDLPNEFNKHQQGWKDISVLEVKAQSLTA